MLMAMTLLLPGISLAQQVKATLDTNMVEIGSQPTLTLSTTVKIGQRVTPPTFKNRQIVPTLEVVQELKPDTLISPNQEVTFSYHYLITSFEDSTYFINRIPILVDRDTIYSGIVKVQFTMLQNVDSAFYQGVDTTREVYKIFDIRDVKQTPWTFEEFWARFGDTILIILVVALLASLITYIVIRKMRNKPIIPISKPKEPAHKTALRRLNELKKRKVAEGKEKEYYSELTEILKTYISDRWGTSVLESTSAETLEVLDSELGKKSEAYAIMDYIFGIADFVKFAKMQSSPEENELALSKAFSFVESTKKVLEDTQTENK